MWNHQNHPAESGAAGAVLNRYQKQDIQHSASFCCHNRYFFFLTEQITCVLMCNPLCKRCHKRSYESAFEHILTATFCRMVFFLLQTLRVVWDCKVNKCVYWAFPVPYRIFLSPPWVPGPGRGHTHTHAEDYAIALLETKLTPNIGRAYSPPRAVQILSMQTSINECTANSWMSVKENKPSGDGTATADNRQPFWLLLLEMLKYWPWLLSAHSRLALV